MDPKQKKDELLSFEDMLQSVQEKLQQRHIPSLKVEDHPGKPKISRAALNEITKQLTGQLPAEEVGGADITPQEAEIQKQKKLDEFLKETEPHGIDDPSGNLSDILLDTPERIEQTRSRQLDMSKIKEKHYQGISERELLEYHEFKKSRMQKARDFVLNRYHTHTLHTHTLHNHTLHTAAPPLYDEQTQEALSETMEKKQSGDVEVTNTAETLERRTKKDDAAINEFLTRLKKNSERSAWIAILLAAATGLLSLLNGWFILQGLWAECCLLGFDLAALLVAGFYSKDVLISGMQSLIHIKANRDTLPSLALTGSLVQILFVLFYTLFVSSGSSSFLLAPIALTSLAFHHYAGVLLSNRSLDNLAYIGEKPEIYGSDIVENEELAADLTKGALYQKPSVAYNRKTSFITHFIYHSFLEDLSDRMSFFLAPAAALISLTLFLISLWISKSVLTAVTAFASCLSIFAPFSLMLSVQMPLTFVNKKMKESSAALLGFSAAEEFGQLNAALTTAHDLFPNGSVTLRGMRAFQHHPIDHSILTAASMLHATNSILRDMFMQVLLNRTDILKPVDSVLLEDGLGISGWVDNRHVIIGNREMAINHNIDMPPIEEEKRLCPEGYKIVYLCISGELTAAFVFALSADKKIVESLSALSENQISLVVQTVDPAISSKTLSEVFGMDEQEIKILPARFNATYRKQTKEVPSLSSPVVNDGSFSSYIQGVLSAKKLSINLFICGIVLVASVLLGVLILVVFSSMGHLDRFSAFLIFFYQLIWSGITLAIPYARNG